MIIVVNTFISNKVFSQNNGNKQNISYTKQDSIDVELRMVWFEQNYKLAPTKENLNYVLEAILISVEKEKPEETLEEKLERMKSLQFQLEIIEFIIDFNFSQRVMIIEQEFEKE